MNTVKFKDLTQRERNILKAIIEDYIDNNHPVGSNYLISRHLIPLSSATIRNIMAKLETSGLLTHPHTSSGRIPTDAGYRFYVDELLDETVVSTKVRDNVLAELMRVSYNVDELMQVTAMMMAKISRLFGAVIISGVRNSILTDIELLPLSSDRVMLVLAMTSGLIRSIVLNLNVSVNSSKLTAITNILKEKLIGLSLEEIQNTVNDRLLDTQVYHHEIIQILLEHKEDHFNISSNKLVYTSTYYELLHYPEFQEIEILQKTLLALNSDHIKNFISSQIGNEHECTLIGEENNDSLLSHCTVMTTRFITNTIQGQLAILGPKRLPYRQVKSILENFAEIIPNVC